MCRIQVRFLLRCQEASMPSHLSCQPTGLCRSVLLTCAVCQMLWDKESGSRGAVRRVLGTCPSSLSGEVQVMVEKVPFNLTLHITFPSWSSYLAVWKLMPISVIATVIDWSFLLSNSRRHWTMGGQKEGNQVILPSIPFPWVYAPLIVKRGPDYSVSSGQKFLDSGEFLCWRTVKARAYSCWSVFLLPPSILPSLLTSFPPFLPCLYLFLLPRALCKSPEDKFSLQD